MALLIQKTFFDDTKKQTCQTDTNEMEKEKIRKAQKWRENVLHFSRFDPLGTWRGFGPSQATLLVAGDEFVERDETIPACVTEFHGLLEIIANIVKLL